MTKRKSLISIFLSLAIVCFTASFIVGNTKQVVAESTTTTYTFTESTDAEAFSAAQLNGWVIKDGKYYPSAAGAQYNANAAKLNTLLDLSKKQEISLTFFTDAPEVEFGLLDSSSSNIWGNIRAITYYLYQGTTPNVGLQANIDRPAAGSWLGDNISVGDLTNAEHTLKITAENGVITFAIDNNVIHTDSTFTAVGAYFVVRAVSENAYIDDLTVTTTEETAVEEGDPNDEVIDFNIASDADLFTAAGSGGWAISSNKYAPVNGWAVSRYSTAIDLTKKWEISLDFAPATNETQFNIGLKYSEVEGENAGVGISARDQGYKTVWLDSNLGGGWQGDYLVDILDGLSHKLVISIDNKVATFTLDGVSIVASNGVSSLTATNDTAYLAFQATSTSSYVDNIVIKEIVVDNVVDFGVATDAELGGGWKILDSKFVPNQGWAVAYNKTAIDTTKNQVIVLDFNAATDETQFNIGLRSSIVEGENTNSVGISVRNSTVWFDNAFGIGWVAENPTVNWIDGQTRQLMIIINDGKVSFVVDGALFSTRYMDGEQEVWLDSMDIPADTMYLAFQATSTSSYVDNIIVANESVNVTINDIAGEEVKVDSALGAYVLPELNVEGKVLLGYNVNGSLVKAGSTIYVVEDTTLTAVLATFGTVQGASIRLDAPTGMRFRSFIDVATIDYLAELNAEYSAGTLIAKSADIVEEGSVNVTKLTVESDVKKLNIVKTSGGEFVDGETLYFNAAIVSIKANHYDWDFTARAYLTVTFADGTTLTVYTEGYTSSVSEVAAEALADEEANWSNDDITILQGFIVSNTSVYVSVDGSDNNNGGSFGSAVATLEKALELANSQKKTIILGDGEYFIDSTVEINNSDVTITARTTGSAVLSGAQKIDKSSIIERTDATLGRVWEINYGQKVSQLYVNNSYAIRARYPDAGEELRMLYADTVLKQITIDAEDISGFSVSDITGSIFVPTISWGESYLRVTNVATATCGGNSAFNLRFNSNDNIFFTRSMKIHPRASYHFENSKAFLNAQGEWFYDETLDKLYYLPFDGETLDNTILRIPVTNTLVSVAGTADGKIANVNFDGVSFMYTANDVDGKIGGQANVNHSETVNQIGLNAGRPSSAFTVCYADYVNVTNAVFACTANGAIDLSVGVSNAKISNNVLRHIGGNGIIAGVMVTEADEYISAYEQNSNVGVSNITVENNYITDIGWQEYSGVGVIYTYVLNGYIKNNTIAGVNYSGISAGWGWSTLETASEVLGNLHITSNKITNACRTMNDGGAIYLTGCMPNSSVTGNVIKNVYNYVYRYPLDKYTTYDTYTQIWWANVGVYLDTGAGSDSESTSLNISGNYIADDIENQKYEFCNTDLYYTIDGKTGASVGINPTNTVTEQDLSNAGVLDNKLISSSPVLYGSHTVSTSVVTVYGKNLVNASLYIDGVLLSDSVITQKTDEYITFNTSSLSVGGHTAHVGESKTFITIGVDATVDGITRFDDKYGGYSALASMVVTKKKLTNFESSSSIDGYTADMAGDGKEYTGWSMDMDVDAGNKAWVSFEINATLGSKISYFVIYERAGGSFDKTTATNFRVLGYSITGQEIELYNTNGAQAFDNGGMLVLDIQGLGYASTYFKSFKIEKTVVDEYFFVAEVAVI